MKLLYFDCFSGLSGDMIIAALLDAGADFNRLQEELKKLNIDEEYELKWKKVIKNGITSTKFDVILNDTKESLQHDHVHTDGHHHSHTSHTHEHTHSHTHTHSHSDGHTHEHSHGHTHSHHHRSYKDIVEMIETAGFNEAVEKMALDIFKKIGEAEGKIHGVSLDKVHFHEVGAVDSIIDIVGAAILLDQLNIDRFVSASVPMGTGHIHIDHGVYPVPAPATLEIMKGIPVQQSNLKAELTTPTGAAIVAVIAEEFGTIPTMKIETIGYGAGTKTFPNHPNVLRVIIGEQ
ncbi:nickel pincer cofactor biosynthesis protein LarC [Aquibacillus rhizosphaerae]|uniref:LarC family nickel insertion protein n=1 Tax=Aquibacillus rhizosphaerae TaxID=3051431 RepID=A0ABT7L935_9BACI|nr:LarC family nickel insertion protein [Aquibacillus sp. LR5S19]MDL4842379.1 LarC family nickel insertion protein [Aquibacillus sp. LR5S19]